MELLNEIEYNPIIDIKKEEENTLLDENVHKSSMKKFYNTVFATKMRNRRNEDRFEELESKEDFTSCKSASVDATCHSPKTVPQLNSSIEDKNCKKKLQWRLDKIEKKRKKSNKEENIGVLKNENISEINNRNEDVDTRIYNSEKEDILMKDLVSEDRLKSTLCKDEVQRRKSGRQVPPMMFFDDNWDFETKPDNGSIPEEKFSCRRTEKFVGKLNTREARILNIETILKQENEPYCQNNNNNNNSNNNNINLDVDEKDLLDQYDENHIFKNNKIIKKYDDADIIKNSKSELSIESCNDLKDNVDKEVDIDKSIVGTLKNTQKEVIVLESNSILQNVIETKENIKVELPTCRRIVPFVNKNLQNASSSISKKLIEIDCIKSDTNIEFESSKNIKITSDFSQKDVNVQLISSEISDTITNSNDDVDIRLNTTINAESNVIDSLKDGSKLNCSVQDNDIKINSCIETELKANFTCLPNNLSLKLQNPLCNEDNEEMLSCQRIQPYLGKNYPNCSRTLSFVHLVNKVKSQDTPETSAKLPNNLNLLNQKVPDRLHLDDESKKMSNQNEDTNIPEKIENGLLNTMTIDTVDLGNGSSNKLVQNGEWKFRRKRPSNRSENAQQVVDGCLTKCSIKISSDPLKNSKSSIFPACSGGTICSLFSLNCLKHAHSNVHNNEYLKSQNEIIKDVFVVLTKLEYIKDPLVLKYFKKIDFDTKVKHNLLPSTKNQLGGDKINTSLNSWSYGSSINLNEQTAKDDLSNCNARNMTSSMSYSNGQLGIITNVEGKVNQEMDKNADEFPTEFRTRLRKRPLSRSFVESLNIFHGKRRKRRVNYIEDYSDSEINESGSSILKQQRMHLQTRRLTLRERQNFKIYGSKEMDENDMEVEEFTRIGLQNRTQSKGDDSSNVANSSNRSESHAIEDSDTFDHTSRSRVTSVSENVEGKQSVQPIHKIFSSDSLNKFDEQTLNEHSQIRNDENKDIKADEFCMNRIQLRSRSRILAAGHLKILQQTELTQKEEHISGHNVRAPILNIDVKNERNSSTFKVSNKSNSKKSKVSKIDEFSVNKRNASSILSRNEKENTRINRHKSVVSSRSSKQSKINTVEKLSNSELKFEPSSIYKRTIDGGIPLRNPKVELIRLEMICESFEDYSASEIELLTGKYIDMLMNSNFTCDTWRNSLNYHPPEAIVEKHVDQIDNSDCVSDIDSQQESVKLVTMVESEDNVHTEDNVDKVKVKSPAKSNTKQIESTFSSFTTLESAIATLVDTEPGEQRNFGAINISEVLNSPSNSVNEKEKDQTIELNDQAVDNNNQRQLNLCDKQLSVHDAILVNGTTMYGCSVCNRIFVAENLLRQHQSANHKDNDAAASCIDSARASTSKSSIKHKAQASGRSCSKKAMPEKCKRKLKFLESLKCTICSITFNSKEELFDHIMTHNEQELQEAYKVAKAKAKKQQSERSSNMSEESDKATQQTAEDSHDKEIQNKTRNKSTDSSNRSSRSSVDVEDLIFENPLNNTPCTRTGPVVTVDAQQQLIELECNETLVDESEISMRIQCSKTVTICSCHEHETIPQDLQIEMVLLCKTCNVVFRRRDCFEVHYRMNLECRRQRTNNEVTKIPKLFCSGCPCVLDSLMDMRMHLEMHARKNCQGTVTFICNICKVAFFGVGGIFYSHWFNHTKSPNFVASRYSFPKLSVVSVVEDSNFAITTSKSQEGFFYIAEHVCRQCRLPFSSEPELLKHKTRPCQSQQSTPRTDGPDSNRLQMIKLICDLCKKYYVSKENFDRHCSERNHLKTPITKFSRLPINANEQAFVCSLCRAVSKSLDDLKEHWKRIHSPIMELYTCKTCNVVPSNDVTNYTYDKFERHCRIVHKSEVITCLVYFVTARYVCNICRFGFETEKSMKEHQVVHQKRSSQNKSANTSLAGLPIEQQMTTMWVADKHVASDGGRKVHPVYVHYPGVNNKRVVPILPAPPKNQSQQSLQPCNSSTASDNPTSSSPSIASSSTNTSLARGSNSMLRNMLAQRALDQPQPPEQNCTTNSSVETILIDSRSNSPSSDSPAPIARDKSGTSGNDAVIASKKSYMTMVNPNFESLLGTNSSLQTINNNNDGTLLDKDNSGGTATPVSMDSLTPQPFEVVLVTDDLSENSNSESLIVNDRNRISSADKGLDIVKSNTNQQKQQTTEKNEVSSAKSSKFLRVRSIAELQHMKIHLCSTCGLSFDTPHAFDQHSRQHEIIGEANRMTPVQMISPMLAQNNKELNDSQNMLISQASHKLALLTPSGKELPPTYGMYNKSNASALSNQLYQPLQQQQYQQYKQQHHPSYWFASCNDTYNANQPNLQYNAYSRHNQQLHHQQSHHHAPQHQLSHHQPLHNQPPHHQPSHHQPPHHQSHHQPQHHQQQHHQPQHHQQQHHQQSQSEKSAHQSSVLRRPVNLNNANGTYVSRGPPPAYPSTSNSMTPSRSSSIQLPERNTTGSSVPTPKRPSGAATRIPQQSLPNFGNGSEHRQTAPRIPYNLNEDVNNSRIPPNHQAIRHSQHSQYKNYSRNSSEMSYSGGSIIANPNYHHSQQQSSKVMYTCKLKGCPFRSDNISALRAHEKNHINQQLSAISSNLLQQQQQQQQRLPIKHVPVSQMPERTRHAIPTSRPPVHSSLDKRYICRVCNICCTSSTELIDHMAQCHNTPSSQLCCYICDYCPTPLIFDSEDLLRKHMHSNHNHFCELCNKRYPSKEDLIIHMEVHARAT